jgi:hypothetical protein
LKRASIRIVIAFFGVVLAMLGAIQSAGAEPTASLSENVDLAQVSAMGPTNRWLQNYNSSKCMLVQGAADHNPAVQFQCLDYADQYWTFHYYGNVQGEWLWVRNVNSGKCLVVHGGSDGAPLVQFPCTEYVDQAWRLWPR